MKIVCMPNFPNEVIADFLVAENIKSEEHAKVMCDALQAEFGGENSSAYFQVMPDEYRLWRGMRDLV